MTVKINASLNDSVVLEACRRQGLQRRPFFAEHSANLALRGTVNPCEGPPLVPAHEVRVLFLDAFEGVSLQCRILRVAHGRLDLSLEVGRVWSTRQGDDAVMLEHRGVELIESRVVNVGINDAFAEVVEPNRRADAAKVCECLLVELAPDFRGRFPHGFAERVPAKRERHHEEPRSAVFSGGRLSRVRALSVIDLHLLPQPSSRSGT